jgi:parvulin-like peptidyl-prolyl isomerase
MQRGRKRKMKKIVSLLFLMFTIAFAQEKEVLLDKIAIIVNDKPVLMSEIELAQKWFNIKSKKEAAQKLIDQILLYQEAKSKGIRVMPQEVESAIERIANANNVSSIEEFKKLLENQDIAYNEFYDLIKREIAINKYIQYIIKPKILENSKEAALETYRQVRIIYLDKNSSDFEKKYEFIEKNLTKNNFEEIAKKYSDDKETSKEGGLLGKVKKGELVDFLDKAVWSAKVGDIKQVNTDKGVYFIYVEKEIKELKPKEISNQEIIGKIDNELQLTLKKLKEKAVIQYLDKSLQG